MCLCPCTVSARQPDGADADQEKGRRRCPPPWERNSLSLPSLCSSTLCYLPRPPHPPPLPPSSPPPPPAFRFFPDRGHFSPTACRRRRRRLPSVRPATSYLCHPFNFLQRLPHLVPLFISGLRSRVQTPLSSHVSFVFFFPSPSSSTPAG